MIHHVSKISNCVISIIVRKLEGVIFLPYESLLADNLRFANGLLGGTVNTLALILLGVALSYSAPKNAGNLSGPNTVKPGRLDSVKVHKLYLDGEFDIAIQILEATFKEKTLLSKMF